MAATAEFCQQCFQGDTGSVAKEAVPLRTFRGWGRGIPGFAVTTVTNQTLQLLVLPQSRKEPVIPDSRDGGLGGRVARVPLVHPLFGPEAGGSCLKSSGLCVAEPRAVTAASLTSALSRARSRQKPHIRKAAANQGPQYPAAGVAAAEHDSCPDAPSPLL